MRELRPWLGLLRTQWRRLLAGTLLMTATMAASVGLLSLSGWFITATGVTALLWAAGIAARLEIYVPGGGIRFFALARTVSRYFERVINHDAVLQMLADLRARLFAGLLPLDPATLSRFRSADLLNRITTDIDALDNLYLRALAPPAAAAALLLGLTGLVYFLTSSGMLAGLLLGGLLLALALLAWVALRAGDTAGQRIVARTEALRTHTLEAIEGMAEWIAFAGWRRQREQLHSVDQRRLRDQQRIAQRVSACEAASGWIVHITALTTLWVAIGLYHDGAISGPVAALLPLAVLAAGEAFNALPGSLVELGRTRAAATRLNAITATTPIIRDPEQPVPLPQRRDLRFANVTFRYNTADVALFQQLDLHVEEGETVAILGPSGAGKSTLAALACRLVEPEQGTILLGGTDITTLRLSDLHTQIAYLTQRSELFADTIADNLRLAAPHADTDALFEALHVAALDDFVAELPDGLDTWVGENGIRLSGGQARRLALARVILRNAPVVLLDEPFSGLDEETAQRVQSRLDAWLTGRTSLILAHAHQTLPTFTRGFCITRHGLQASE